MVTYHLRSKRLGLLSLEGNGDGTIRYDVVLDEFKGKPNYLWKRRSRHKIIPMNDILEEKRMITCDAAKNSPPPQGDALGRPFPPRVRLDGQPAPALWWEEHQPVPDVELGKDWRCGFRAPENSPTTSPHDEADAEHKKPTDRNDVVLTNILEETVNFLKGEPIDFRYVLRMTKPKESDERLTFYWNVCESWDDVTKEERKKWRQENEERREKEVAKEERKKKMRIDILTEQDSSTLEVLYGFCEHSSGHADHINKVVRQFTKLYKEEVGWFVKDDMCSYVELKDIRFEEILHGLNVRFAKLRKHLLCLKPSSRLDDEPLAALLYLVRPAMEVVRAQRRADDDS